MSKPEKNQYDRPVHPYVVDDTWCKRLYSPRSSSQYSAAFSDAERDFIFDFITEKIAVDRIKSARRVKIVTMLATFKRFMPCEYQSLTVNQWQQSIIALNSSDLSENTKHDVVVVVKAFLQYLLSQNNLPNLQEKQIIRIRPVEAPQITKTPDELPSPEEIHQMTTNPTCTVMFAAFLNTLYYTGMRSAECLGLNWEDVVFDRNMVKIRILDTKESGYRYAPCVEAKTYLANWKRHYPLSIEGGPNGKNPVWITQSQRDGTFSRLQYDRARQWFIDMQDRCHIKPRNSKSHYGFHACRAAHITNCALNGMSDAVNKQLHWANQGTGMMKKYCLLSDDSVDRAVLEMAGIQEEKHKDIHGVLLCPSCSSPNGPYDDFCHFCGSPLNAKAASKQANLWDKFTSSPDDDIDIVGRLAAQLKMDRTELKRKLTEII
ncbi:MAG TPA: site-specific integrase [Methanocorpusculum sp.]|nr:site-specific integrase [Methanocorpusculum sp.]HJJ59844.1 site-specific integrase [Methanocorpusculum sp.]